MNDKRNILGSLMSPNGSNDEENGGTTTRGSSRVGDTSVSSKATSRLIQPTSGSSTSKQHKLKQRFTVIRKLGKGTYGKVQLAINKETGQEVAIKTIKKTKIENEQDLQRVRREIQIMSSIEHPHIIHIYEVFENKDKIVLVMQYAPGGELYEYVSQSKLLDDSEARRLFRQIATAIYYCHQNKICHRDLKLENILLDEKNNAKLADFGLSNVFDKSYQLKTFCGSPLYASPEIVQGSPYEGPEVDCWSLGVLLYTLVYGAMPFDGSNFKRLVKQISESCYFEPQQKSQASPLIRKLLCANPKERATILDICSDPWVNGLQSMGLAPATAHQSLLKVSQDMANLTPVRIDILLALTPDSMAAAAAAAGGGRNSALAARPPLARIDNNNNKRRSSGGDAAADVPAWRLDPSIMEVEEGRSTSPVASYIVRDLSNDKTSTVASNHLEMENNVLEPRDQGNKIHQDESQVEHNYNHQGEQPIQEERVKQEAQQQLDRLDGEKQQVSQEPIDTQIEAKYDNNNDHSMCEDEPIGSIELNQNEQHEKDDHQVDIETAIEITAAAAAMNDSLQVDASETEDVVKMDVDSGAQSTNGTDQVPEVQEAQETATMSENVTPTTIDTKQNDEPTKDIQIEEPPKLVDGDEQAGETDKPKKVVKKKIVVKKRKKRVSKKDEEGGSAIRADEDKSGKAGKDNEKDTAAGADAGGCQEDLDAQKKQDNGEASGKLLKAKQQQVGPGKVRIPNTFQLQSTNQEPPPVKAEARRQSTLVADVSQKLLQQSQAAPSTNAVNLIATDQPQLASVRVSDKKSEFERRASLAAPVSPPSNSKPVTPPTVPELCQAELLHEPFGDEQLTIVEPVERREPIDIEPAPGGLKPPGASTQDEGSESQTPTRRQSIELQAADVRRKLERASQKLGSELPLADESSGNGNRSDSVETIRADASCSPIIFEAPSVRSHFSINLDRDNEDSSKELANSEMAAASQRAQLTAGLAPIMRSYKKVTFTKDGACITETGKIYSTQADDGTVRRVERKSKVTHYPVEGSGFSTAAEGANGTARSEQVEEEVYEEGGGESVWQERQSSFLGRQSALTNQRRPLESLIMPTEIGSDLMAGAMNQQEFASSGMTGGSQARPPSFSGRARSHSRQLGRADSSCSSCSSGSTDVFDDIFDHWTGAISMFNQGGHHFRPFGGRTSSRASGRRTQAGSTGGGSLAGTPRCESAEPPSGPMDGQPGGHLHNRRRRHREWRSPGANTSGYESDAASERPATALGGSALNRGSLSRLFPSIGIGGRASDPFFADTEQLESPFVGGGGIGDLRRTIEQEHKNLRRRLEQQHKQLWKGSTPSLFQVGDDDPLMEPAHIRARRQPPQPEVGSIGHLLRGHLQQHPGEEARHDTGGWRRPPRPESSVGTSSAIPQQQHQHQQKVQQQSQSVAATNQAQSWPREVLEQSQSSSSFLRQSVALDSAPIRRINQTVGAPQLPPRHEVQSMRRSTSRVSLLNSKNLGEEAAIEQQQTLKHQASFIELKRTSSSTSAAQQQRQVAAAAVSTRQQHESTTTTTTTSSSRVISNSGSSSALWQTVITPTTPLSCGTQSGPLTDVEDRRSSTRDNLDSRVQSWLQESTGNMSTSSGSKSSVSEQSRQAEVAPTSGSSRRFGPVDTTGQQSPAVVSIQQQQAIAQQKEVSQSALSSVMLSSTSSSSANWANEHQHQQLESLSSRNIICDRTSEAPRNATNVTTRTTLTLRQPPLPPRSPEAERACESFVSRQQQHHVSSSQSSITSRRQTPPTTAPIGTTEGSQWIQESSCLKSIFGEELEESLSGGCSAELESRSSSSLLDQLRSRGYRSMINQRMVSQQTGGVALQAEQPVAATTQTSSTSQTVNRQETTNSTLSSRVVTSSSKVVQQQHRQIVTSSSSSTNTNTSSSTTQRKSAFEDGCDYEAGCRNIVELKETDCHQLSNGITQPENGDGFCASKMEQNHKSTNQIVDNIDCDVVDTSDKSANEGILNEEDEDVREAKASIKSHLDRVKETEMFLKSLHAEEAEAERRRQQLFMFNNLMLSSKLNGMKSRPLNDDDNEIRSLDADTSCIGARSAPVYFGMTPRSEGCGQVNNVFMTQPPAPALSLTKDCLLSEMSDSCFGVSPGFGYASRKLREQPLPSLTTTTTAAASHWKSNTINGYDSPPSLMTTTRYQARYGRNANDLEERSRVEQFRRSRSQLGDQFSETISASPRRACRPVSANLTDSLGTMISGCDAQTQNCYFPSRSRRSLSQIRQSTNNRLSSYASNEHQNSGYASPRAALRQQWNSIEPASEVNLTTDQKLVVANDADADDDDDDHGLGAYRTSAYVPKVVPRGMPARGRSYQPPQNNKRLATSDWSLNQTRRSDLADLDATRTSLKAYEEVKRERRISLQEAANSKSMAASKASPLTTSARLSSPSYRRRSMTTSLPAAASAADSSSGQGERSRLSELEQRIQENKRRREELLAGRISPEPATVDSKPKKEKSLMAPAAAPTTTVPIKLNSRPSRLESMEARIKRRSYCVRTSPERSYLRSQQNFDKWKTDRTPGGRRLSNGAHLDSSSDGWLAGSLKWKADTGQEEECTE